MRLGGMWVQVSIISNIAILTSQAGKFPDCMVLSDQ